jgi:hypothetical protein
MASGLRQKGKSKRVDRDGGPSWCWVSWWMVEPGGSVNGAGGGSGGGRVSTYRVAEDWAGGGLSMGVARSEGGPMPTMNDTEGTRVEPAGVGSPERTR